MQQYKEIDDLIFLQNTHALLNFSLLLAIKYLENQQNMKPGIPSNALATKKLHWMFVSLSDEKLKSKP